MTIGTFALRLAGASLAIPAVMDIGAAAAGDLNALVWCDHADPHSLRPFDEANGVRINVREFEGSGTVVDKKMQNPWTEILQGQ